MISKPDKPIGIFTLITFPSSVQPVKVVQVMMALGKTTCPRRIPVSCYTGSSTLSLWPMNFITASRTLCGWQGTTWYWTVPSEDPYICGLVILTAKSGNITRPLYPMCSLGYISLIRFISRTIGVTLPPCRPSLLKSIVEFSYPCVFLRLFLTLIMWSHNFVYFCVFLYKLLNTFLHEYHAWE